MSVPPKRPQTGKASKRRPGGKAWRRHALFWSPAIRGMAPRSHANPGAPGISDGVVELQHISGWTEYLHIVDRKLSYGVDSLFTALEDGVFWF